MDSIEVAFLLWGRTNRGFTLRAHRKNVGVASLIEGGNLTLEVLIPHNLVVSILYWEFEYTLSSFEVSYDCSLIFGR